jgi:hypothetical protein
LLRWLAVIAALPSLTTAFAAAGVIASLGRRRGSGWWRRRLRLLRRRCRWRRLLRRWRGLGLLRRRSAVAVALPSLTTAFVAAIVVASLDRGRRGRRLRLLRRRWLLRGWRRLGLLRRRPTLPVTIATATAFATALVVVALLC